MAQKHKHTSLDTKLQAIAEEHDHKWLIIAGAYHIIMGIQGLLPYLKKASRSVNIREFKGCTVAIDTYCWLHRGAFACAEKLAMGEKTDQYVYYCMKYVNHLLSLGIKPIMVFDGCHLPSKKEVETTRRERRETYRKKAAQLLREGKRSEARDCLTKCIDITPQMALELMIACRAKDVDCIVAPYEADAQLAYLNKIGVAQIIITEDSDLVLFGCDKVMFKMDPAGNGVMIEKRHLNMAMDLRPDSYTFDKFRYMCILSGCDYLASLAGIGLAKANKVFKLTHQTDMTVVVKKLASTLNMSKLVVTSDYVTGFHKADNTFLYQLVFDPIKRRLVPLNPYPPEVDPDQMHYAGPPLEREKALQIALGNIDIYTGKPISDFDPDTHQPKSQSWKNQPHGRDTKQLLHMLSIWNRNYHTMPRISQHTNTETNRQTTRGQEVTVTMPKVIKKPIVVKRPREEDEVSPEELLSAYNNADPEYNPEKRARTPCRPEDILPPHTQDSPPHTEHTDDTVIQGATKHQQFPDTIRAEHRDKDSHEMLNSTPCKTECDEDTEKSASNGKSPGLSPGGSKNLFAVSSLRLSRDKFSLNASKRKAQTVRTEIKSRFFREKKPMRQTDFFGQLDKSHEHVEKGDDTDSGESDSDVETSVHGQDKKTNVSKPQILVPATPDNTQTENRSLNSQDDRQSQSPYGSFGFKKKVGSSFLDKFRSDPDKSTTCQQTKFKPVMPRAGSVDSVYSSKVESSKADISNCGESTEEIPSETGVDSSSVSEHSNLYSIDSYSRIDINLMDTPQNNTSQHVNTSQNNHTFHETDPDKCTGIGSSYFSGSNNSGLVKKRGSLPGTSSSSSKLKTLNSFYRTSLPNTPSSSGTQGDSSHSSSLNHSNNTSIVVEAKSSATPSKPQGSTKVLGGARASGLSKSTSKKKGPSTKDKSTIENQPAINNFFSKFSHGKSSTPKLSSIKSTPQKSTTKVLSPHRENVITESDYM